MDQDNPGSLLCQLVSTKQLILPGVDHPRIVSRLDSTEEYDSVKIILVTSKLERQRVLYLFLFKRYGTRQRGKGSWYVVLCNQKQSVR